MVDQWAGFQEPAKAIRHGPPLTEEDLKQVDANVRRLYENGTPFFTRQALCRIGQQLAQAAKDNITHIIPIQALDGVTVEFEVKIANPKLATEQDPKHIAQSALLLYLTPEMLASFSGNDPTTAYCNVQILHQMVLQNNIVESGADLTTQSARKEVDKVLSHVRQVWEASEQCKQLRDTLARAIDPERIGNIIGLAFGPLSGTDLHGSSISSSAYQHALLFTLREILTKPSSREQILCYVQDPAYATADKMVLRESGITVLEDPGGFVEIDDDSVVLAFAPDCPVKEIVFDLAKPALIIWNTVRHDELKGTVPIEGSTPGMASPDAILWADPDGARVRQSIRAYYDELAFPVDEEHFGDVSMYIKRTIQSS